MHTRTTETARANTESIPATTDSPFPRSVVFVAPFGLGQKTTVWARTLPLAQYLARNQIVAKILIPPWDTPAHSGLKWVDGGVEIENVRLPKGPPLILARMIRRLQLWNPDIIHIVKPTAYAGAIHTLLWYLRTVARVQSKLVLDVDDWEQAWAEFNQRPYLGRKLIQMQENWGLGHAHGITAASNWLREKAQGTLPDRPVCYLPNGVVDRTPPDQSQTVALSDSAQVDMTSLSPAWLDPAPSPKILFFTRFIEIEPTWFCRFVQSILDRHPTTEVHIAGSGVKPEIEADFKQRFQAGATDSQLPDRQIHWLGYVEKERLQSLYESCNCAIFPAQETSLQQAKCSVKMATTLLHGIPIIASAVGEQQAYGQMAGVLLVSPGASPVEFADAVVNVLENPAEQTRKQRAALPHLLQNYSWENLGQRLLHFYRTL